MSCQSCGAHAPTREVRFHRHIGLVLVFLHSRVGGQLCRRCLDSAFWSTFGVTLVAGWWGLLSLFATLFVLPYDLVLYVLTRRSFARETDSGAGGRVGLAALSGGMAVLGCLVTGPLVLVGALAGALASGGDRSELALVCAGHPVIDAPAYSPSSAPTLIAFSSSDGRWVEHGAMAPEAWRADDPALVACVEPERETVVEQCPRGDAAFSVVRTRYPREVRIVAARTAAEVGRASADSLEDPEPCGAFAPTVNGPLVVRSSAPRAQPADVARALQRWATER